MGRLMILSGVTVAVLLSGDLQKHVRLGGAAPHPRLWRCRPLRRLFESEQAIGGRLPWTHQDRDRSRCRRHRRPRDRLRSQQPLATSLTIPFFKDIIINLGWWYLLFAVLVIVGAGNAVNLTDGLDGLAIGPVIIAGATYGLMAYGTERRALPIISCPPNPGDGGARRRHAALIGGGLGFLWYNAHPEDIFMGDTGSLALGGALGAMAIASRTKYCSPLVGGLFVLEALSVILQVALLQVRPANGFFHMAPIHHHFEKLGWSEPTVVIRFWIVAFLLALLGLAALRLRWRQVIFRFAHSRERTSRSSVWAEAASRRARPSWPAERACARGTTMKVRARPPKTPACRWSISTGATGKRFAALVLSPGIPFRFPEPHRFVRMAQMVAA